VFGRCTGLGGDIAVWTAPLPEDAMAAAAGWPNGSPGAFPPLPPARLTAPTPTAALLPGRAPIPPPPPPATTTTLAASAPRPPPPPAAAATPSRSSAAGAGASSSSSRPWAGHLEAASVSPAEAAAAISRAVQIGSKLVARANSIPSVQPKVRQIVLTRSGVKPAQIQAFPVSGEVAAVELAQRVVGSAASQVSISHRVKYEDIRQLLPLAVLLLEPATSEARPQVLEYQQYFEAKARAGVARLQDASQDLYVLPPSAVEAAGLLSEGGGAGGEAVTERVRQRLLSATGLVGVLGRSVLGASSSQAADASSLPATQAGATAAAPSGERGAKALSATTAVASSSFSGRLPQQQQQPQQQRMPLPRLDEAAPATVDQAPPPAEREEAAEAPQASGAPSGPEGDEPLSSPSMATFFGRWTDTLGHDVVVKPPSASDKRVEAVFSKAVGGDKGRVFRASIEQENERGFLCGHYRLQVGQSSARRLLWRDLRRPTATSTWTQQERFSPPHETPVVAVAVRGPDREFGGHVPDGYAHRFPHQPPPHMAYPLPPYYMGHPPPGYPPPGYPPPGPWGPPPPGAQGGPPPGVFGAQPPPPGRWEAATPEARGSPQRHRHADRRDRSRRRRRRREESRRDAPSPAAGRRGSAPGDEDAAVAGAGDSMQDRLSALLKPRRSAGIRLTPAEHIRDRSRSSRSRSRSEHRPPPRSQRGRARREGSADSDYDL